MADLKIKDIETLERLSFDDMEQVVGGRGRGFGLGKRWRRKFKGFGCGGGDVTAQAEIISNPGGGSIGISDLSFNFPL